MKRTLINYLTGTVPEDPWWMYAYNIVMLVFCVAFFGYLVTEFFS